MKIKILFDKESLNNKFKTGWGFSCLIDNKIMFDTGEKSEYLFNNMELMDVDVSRIDGVVISHDHWDHTGGLWGLLRERKGLAVFGCPGFGGELKKKVESSGAEYKEYGGFKCLSGNIFVTGEIKGTYKGSFMPEQALVIKTTEGLVVITGCAHPGIVKILEEVNRFFVKDKIKLVMGGFHLKDSPENVIEDIISKFKDMGIEKAGPTHCSGQEAEGIFRKHYSYMQVCLAVMATFFLLAIDLTIAWWLLEGGLC